MDDFILTGKLNCPEKERSLSDASTNNSEEDEEVIDLSEGKEVDGAEAECSQEGEEVVRREGKEVNGVRRRWKKKKEEEGEGREEEVRTYPAAEEEEEVEERGLSEGERRVLEAENQELWDELQSSREEVRNIIKTVSAECCFEVLILLSYIHYRSKCLCSAEYLVGKPLLL